MATNPVWVIEANQHYLAVSVKTGIFWMQNTEKNAFYKAIHFEREIDAALMLRLLRDVSTGSFAFEQNQSQAKPVQHSYIDKDGQTTL